MTAGKQAGTLRVVDFGAVFSNDLMRCDFQLLREGQVGADDHAGHVVYGNTVLHSIDRCFPLSLTTRNGLEKPGIFERNGCLLRQGFRPGDLSLSKRPCTGGLAEEQDPQRVVLCH